MESIVRYLKVRHPKLAAETHEVLYHMNTVTLTYTVDEYDLAQVMEDLNARFDVSCGIHRGPKNRSLLRVKVLSEPESAPAVVPGPSMYAVAKDVALWVGMLNVAYHAVAYLVPAVGILNALNTSA